MAARYQHMVDTVWSSIADQGDELIWTSGPDDDDDGTAGEPVRSR